MMMNNKLTDFIKKLNIDNTPDLKFDVAEMVIDARVSRGMTQKELAKKVGTMQPAIARLENGNTLPSLKFLQDVANALGYRVEVFLKEKDKKYKEKKDEE